MRWRYWKRRYRAWRQWRRYTNDGYLAQIGALLSLRIDATLSFHAFWATLKE